MLASLLSVSLTSNAYNVGDRFTVDGITYEVRDRINYKVRVVGISKPGVKDVIVPATVYDGIDQTFSVKSIGAWEATWSNEMVTLRLSEGIEEISHSAAFCYANALETIYLPTSLKSISSGAFLNLASLKDIQVEPDNAYFCSVDGVLYSKDKTELIRYPTKKDVGNNGVYSIPDGVKIVHDVAFSYNASLTEVKVPSSVTEINSSEYGVFLGCGNLKNINVDTGNEYFYDETGVLCGKEKKEDGTTVKTIIVYPQGRTESEYTVPAGIETIKSRCFYNSKFNSINLNGVTTIEKSGFCLCYRLQNINISGILAEIHEGAFEDCSSILNYNVDANNTNYMDIKGVLCNKDGTSLILFPTGRTGEYVIPESITKILVYSFFSSKLTSVTITGNVASISEKAFRLSHLTEVAFTEPSQLTTLDALCFWQCGNLKRITLPSSLELIKEGAFAGCGSLKEVVIPDGSKLKMIGGTAFKSCPQLESVTFEGTCALQTVGPRAFGDCTSLTSFNFPASVTTIGTSAFSGCSGMTTATFDPDAIITTIGRNAFDECGLVSIEIPSSVKSIEVEAFKNCNLLERVVIPASTTTVSPEAFKFCTNLTNIEVSADNTKYSSIDGMLLSKDKETLVLFPAGKANDRFTLLAPSITKIGDYAFYDCANLKNVTIPNKVTSIGQRAFGLCANLNTITFLCDNMIAPANIDQEENTKSFDDTMFGNINIKVRKDQLNNYTGNEFYGKFKSIMPSFTVGTEEYIAVSDNTLDMLSTTSSDNTFIVPQEAVNANDGKTYSVGLIGDYAFQNAGSGMKEVIVFGNVGYIGAKAFLTDITNNSSTIENIFFIKNEPGFTSSTRMLSTLRFNLDETGENYNEFASTQKIYVKKSAVDTYKSIWTKYADAIGYQIPGITIGSKYGTFAREFDTYIGDCEGTKVLAFTGGEYVKGNGDYGDKTEYHIHMESINAAGYDGLYIPKNTGVLLKVMGEDISTPGNFYYCIGEKDNEEHSVGANAMKGVTVNNETISGYDKWVIQNGQFRALNGKTTTMPVHKAYLQLEGAPAGAKLSFLFDDGSTTSIENIDSVAGGADAVYYNLSGMRVKNPQKGVYICNGKKVVIK